MHTLLARQLRKLKLNPQQPPDTATWAEFLTLVGQHYQEEDAGRYTMERAMDISSSDMLASEEKIKHLAFYDSLTKLPNRSLVLERIHQANVNCKRNLTFGALLFLDLDHFKLLNDTLGHDMGDRLLQQVAQRLTTCVRETDTVARLGGDEFVVLLVNLSTDEIEATKNTEMIGKKILATLNQPYLLGDISHRSTPSLGATLFNGQQADIATLLKQADLAMYKSKEAGRNTLCFFNSTLADAIHKRVGLEHDLRSALTNNEFLPHYQAQVDHEGRLTGAELLLRWEHPARGMVAPSEFIPVAEETRLIIPLGLWILEQACLQLVAWAKDAQLAHLTLAVNVSAHEFRHPDFLTQVVAILKRTKVNPLKLKFELTESLVVTQVEDVIAKMHRLKFHGIGISLDDFGMGYSSLSYLKRMPLEQIKIDQSFIGDMLIDLSDASIVKTIVDLAKNLGLNVIAEGVETEQQRNFLNGIGCLAHQGYLYSRPLPLAQFESYARQMPIPV